MKTFLQFNMLLLFCLCIQNANMQDDGIQTTGSQSLELHNIYQLLHEHENKIQILENNIKNLDSLNHGLERKVDTLESVNEDLSARLDSCELRSEMVDDMVLYGAHNMSVVSFTAYAMESRSYESGQTILFDGIVRNYGGYFNPSVSIFICPIRGYYLFSISVITSYTEYNIDIEINLDGESLVSTDVAGNNDQGSTSVVTLCEVGKPVYVSGMNNGDGIYGSPTIHHSTFSGTLLFQA